jgi:hypothetical protein
VVEEVWVDMVWMMVDIGNFVAQMVAEVHRSAGVCSMLV